MEKESQHPRAGMLGCDREVFSRIWSRASTHSEETSPIQVLPPSPRQAQSPPPKKAAPPATLPAAVDLPGQDELRPNDVPCFGRGGIDHGAMLQNWIRAELEAWRAYQFLSTRSTGTTARTLAAMAADERRHAKRLSAAYFLISGVRFFPQVPPHRASGGSFWSLLRSHFWAEQQVSAAYAAAAEETADLCLAALYRELSAEEATHADLLRALVEKMPAN